MITEDYVSFETAKLLKEKGFDEICYLGYNKNGEYFPTSNRTNSQIIQPDFCFICCPTLQMAMKWLRKVYYLHITVHPGVSEYGFVWTYMIVFAKEAGEGDTHFYKINQIPTPIVKAKSSEQAIEIAIKYCLENLI